jgi:hypothetical protein
MDFSAQHGGSIVEIENEPCHHLVLVNEFVRGLAVELPPFHQTLCHHHPHDYVLYVAGISDVVSVPDNDEPVTCLYRDGECEFLPAGLIHEVENLKDSPFRSLVVELLPRARDLRRGPDPTRQTAPTLVGGSPQTVREEKLAEATIAELARVRPHFVHELAALYRAEIRADSAVEITGPAIVGCPYEHQVVMEKSGEKPVKLESFFQMEWLAPGQTALLRGEPVNSTRVVVVQLGSREEQSLPVQARGEPLTSAKSGADEPKSTRDR